MNDLLTFDEVPLNLRTANIGTYNNLIFVCPECDKNIFGVTDEHLVGFGQLSGAVPGHDVVMVIECPGCGIRYYSHAGRTTLRGFLSTQERLAYQRRPNTAYTGQRRSRS